MADDARIAYQRIRSAEGSDIGAADPGGHYPDQSFSGSWHRNGSFRTGNGTRFFKTDSFHIWYSVLFSDQIFLTEL